MKFVRGHDELVDGCSSTAVQQCSSAAVWQRRKLMLPFALFTGVVVKTYSAKKYHQSIKNP